MVDYGIISLLVIQLFMVVGCLFAWNSTRSESNTLKTAFSEEKEKVAAVQRICTAWTEKLSQYDNRLRLLEENAGEAVRAVQIAEDARKQAGKTLETVDDVERSLKAKISALHRWQRPKPDEDEDGIPEPLPATESIADAPGAIRMPSENGARPYTPLQEKIIERTFGKMAR